MKELTDIQKMTAALVDANKMIDGYLRTISELKSRIAELEKDAARYRWLRDICGIVEYKAAFGSIGPGMMPSGENLDVSIDAAMQKG